MSRPATITDLRVAAHWNRRAATNPAVPPELRQQLAAAAVRLDRIVDRRVDADRAIGKAEVG